MRRLLKYLVLLTAVMVLGTVSSAVFAEVTEGQVVLVQEWNLYIRTATNVPMLFNPSYVLENNIWVPSRPARTVLPALESGERVRITWTMDTVENRRRISGIQILSPLTGTMKCTVASVSTSQLVVNPKDEPGAVTLNPRMVLVNGKWVSEPAVVEKLRTLPAKTKITVQWAWDSEGRKRITAITTGW